MKRPIFAYVTSIHKTRIHNTFALFKSKKNPRAVKIQSEHLLHRENILPKYLCVLSNSCLI